MNQKLVERNVDVASARTLGLPMLDFQKMHEIVLPHRLRRGVSEQIAWDVANASPIAFQTTDGAAYTYRYSAGGVKIVRGVSDDATLVIELSSDNWQNYFYELRTAIGLLYSQAVRFARGSFAMWDAWDPALRCLYSGTPIYDPTSLKFVDLNGSPLDIRQSFTRESSESSMSHFLQTTGYLHVRGAFSIDEVALMADELTRVRGLAQKGEIFSRWGKDQSGHDIVYDLHYLAERSPRLKKLDDHPTVRFLTGLAGENVSPSEDRDCGTHAVMREFTGGSDSFGVLGWHQDCGLGGCPITCPRVHVGIQVDAANAESSRLFFLAGSARRACHSDVSAQRAKELPIVAFDTEPGDVTVHLGCTLHAANEAQGKNRRRTIYTRFVNPLALNAFGRFGSIDLIIPGIDGEHSMPSPQEMARIVETATDTIV